MPSHIHRHTKRLQRQRLIPCFLRDPSTPGQSPNGPRGDHSTTATIPRIEQRSDAFLIRNAGGTMVAAFALESGRPGAAPASPPARVGARLSSRIQHHPPIRFCSLLEFASDGLCRCSGRPRITGRSIFSGRHGPNTSKAGRRSRNAPSLNVPPAAVGSSKSGACSPGARRPEKCISSLMKSRRKDS